MIIDFILSELNSGSYVSRHTALNLTTFLLCMHLAEHEFSEHSGIDFFFLTHALCI